LGLCYTVCIRRATIRRVFQRGRQQVLRASASLGDSPVQTFRRIVLPLSKQGWSRDLRSAFAHTLGESELCSWWEAYPGVTRTISIDIYDQVQTANYSSANQTALLR